jgi:general secretion pathway protein C
MIPSSPLTRLALMGVTMLTLGVLAVRVGPRMMSREAPGEPSPALASRVVLDLLPATSSVDRAPSTKGQLDPSAMRAAHELSRRLRLLGTVVEARPFAYIEDTLYGTSRRYWINDTVASATVHAIHRGAVQLRTAQGQHVVLLLEPTEATNAFEPSPDASKASRSPTNVSIQFRPQLSATSGAFEGLVVEVLEPASLASRLGIETGDLIQRVNGQRLLTPAQSLQVLKKAWRQPELALEFQRDERTLTQTVSLRAFQR